MRSQQAVKCNVKSVRLAVAFLLAGVASGCSSDVSRFDGLFSRKTDPLTTASVPHKVNAINGKLPVPREDVAGANNRISQDVTGDAALNQPYPDQISTSTTTYSPTRAAVTPVRVERQELSSPVAVDEERQALTQPMPARKNVLVPPSDADDIKTGTIKSTWKVSDSSPRVMVRSGDTLSGFADRYGVPQSEILKANNMTSASDLKFGRSIIIPVAAKVDPKSKVKPVETAKLGDKKIPVPAKLPEQKKAILPNTAALRDKNKSGDADKVADNSDAAADKSGKVYEVKQGDSLARIAKAHGIGVDQLKEANKLETASIRIGQKLVIPGADMAAARKKADDIKTASVPTTGKVKDAIDSKPKSYTPPVAEKSVEEVQKSADNGEKAPDDTGISKYRWPVRGAVIAGYGQNIDGIRNPGIDISVPEGTPVKAAENGVVIYSGAGLKDLGNTVLVRHDDGTVTVYGNASALNVKRGDKVTRGQVIANSGMSGGAKRPKLHFEVRQKSTPVNPMTFLQ